MSEPDYKLTPEHHAKIRERLVTLSLADAQPRQEPVAIITGGQPGSGKGALTGMARDRFASDGGVVIVDADAVRQRHPHHKELMARDDVTASNHTHADAAAWASSIRMAAVKVHMNVVVDQTSRDPAAMGRLVDGLRAAGYRVEFHVMATRPEISEMRYQQRYEGEKASLGVGRYVPKEHHDNAVAGVVQTVAAVETAKNVDRLVIFDGQQRQIYDNRVREGNWTKPATAHQLMQQDRTRPLNTDELLTLKKGHAAIVAHLENRKAPADKITAAKANLVHVNGQLAAVSPYSRAKQVEPAPQAAKSAQAQAQVQTTQTPKTRGR